MLSISPLLLFVLFLILWAEFVNGWTDAPNAIATVVSTRVLSPKKAVILATGLNILGAFSGTAVAATIWGMDFDLSDLRIFGFCGGESIDATVILREVALSDRPKDLSLNFYCNF